VGRRSGAKFNIEYKRLFGATHGNDHVAEEKQVGAGRLSRRRKMKRRTFVASVAASGASVALAESGLAQESAGTATPAEEGEGMTQTDMQSGYAPVNGLQMYYEIHGSGRVPIVLLHGAYMSTGMMEFLLSGLAKTRQVIAVDLQGHGRTADIDRSLQYEQMADDVAALMEHLGISQADVVGYSMGGSIALQVAIRHSDRVRKLVSASGQYRLDGLYPEVIAGIATNSTPELMMGTPWYENYASVAPNPDDFPMLVEKLKRLDAEEFAWDEAEIKAIAAPALLIYGDADVIRPEHMVELFRLLGGGVPGDFAGLPKARLAILPSTTHVGGMNRADWLLPMITEFLDEPMPEEGLYAIRHAAGVVTDRQPRHDKGGRNADPHARWRQPRRLRGNARWSPGLGCHAHVRTGIARER
jgi:pimeloyl-ACP methyl ester carboxylesterase